MDTRTPFAPDYPVTPSEPPEYPAPQDHSVVTPNPSSVGVSEVAPKSCHLSHGLIRVRCSPCCAAPEGLLSAMPGGAALEALSLGQLTGLGGAGLDFGGWTQFGYHSNTIPLSQAYNDGRSFHDVPDRLHVNQQWIYLGKAANGTAGWDWGFRTDFVYGTDATKTQATGNRPGAFDEDWDHGEYGWAAPQLYGEVAAGDLTVKVGRFFAALGYETVPAPANFFYSRSYALFNTEPFTHTGALATYNGMERVTFYGGWTLGWDTGFDNLNQGNNWLGGFAYRWSEDVRFSYMNTYGNFGRIDGTADANVRDSYSHSVVLSVALTEDLTYALQSDSLRIDNPAAAASILADPDLSYVRDDVGLTQYLFYHVSDVLSVGQRMEWWKQDGASYYESASGVNVRLLNNLVMRPEYRVDWSPGLDVDERTYAMDLILSY